MLGKHAQSMCVQRSSFCSSPALCFPTLPVLGQLYLEDVVARGHICDVNPLAVDVGIVGVVAAWPQALHKAVPLLTSPVLPA